ncbi:hypothetical protein HPS8415995_1404 [Glaesserella parasuis 84-15995]|nr:hypothetical protein HPS8415995_1404 [Glaesserella parasuis 84-15995]
MTPFEKNSSNLTASFYQSSGQNCDLFCKPMFKNVNKINWKRLLEV